MDRRVNDVTLWDNQFAPITSSIGFLRAPLPAVAESMTAWRKEIYGRARSKTLTGGLADNMGKLEPLTLAITPRELLVATANPEWTAVFDCGANGGDPMATCRFLARTMGVDGVVVDSVPKADLPRVGLYCSGSKQLMMYGPRSAGSSNNTVRVVSLTQDGARWRFEAYGQVQPFEDETVYAARRVADRFPGELLVRYAAALGLRPFDGDFYPGPCVLVTNPFKDPDKRPGMSLLEARQRLGLEPSPEGTSGEPGTRRRQVRVKEL